MGDLLRKQTRYTSLVKYMILGFAVLLIVYGYIGREFDFTEVVELTGLSEDAVTSLGKYVVDLSLMGIGAVMFAASFFFNTVRESRDPAPTAIGKVEELEVKVSVLEKELAELKAGHTEDHGNGR